MKESKVIGGFKFTVVRGASGLKSTTLTSKPETPNSKECTVILTYINV
jgi:hypothetical protein